MRPAHHLPRLHRAVERRFQRLKGVVDRIRSDWVRIDGESKAAFVTIELLSTWTNFLRAYYVSCVFKGWARTAPSHCSENAALSLAINASRPPSRPATPKADGSWNVRSEPTWHDTAVFITICRTVGLANTTDIEAALSISTRAFRDLPVFRNFYAHRNRQTERSAQHLAPQYGLPTTRRPSQVLVSCAIGRPQPIVLDWMSDLLFATEYLCS